VVTATAKLARKRTPKRLQGAKTSPARTPRGLSYAPKKLTEIIRLVNLVDPDVDLNSVNLAAVGDACDTTDAPLTYDELSQQMSRNLLVMIADIPFERLKCHLLDCFARPEIVGPGVESWDAPVDRLLQIKSWRDTLRGIARGQRSITSSIIRKFDRRTGETHDLKDDLNSALDEADFRNIRACRACGRIYYAARLLYRGKALRHCSPECRKKLRGKKFQLALAEKRAAKR
jgi:hypothetical protein